MVSLKTLVLSNFRSFSHSEITFPKSGLLLISGRNPGSGDSSGAGKSSILLGIAYALDILPLGFPATELRTWGSKEAMQVNLQLDVDGETVTIGRGKKIFVCRGDREITGAKPVAEEIQKIFGVPPEILSAMTYRPQGAPGLFLSRTPAEKAEFLVPLLGLDSVERAVEQAELNIKTISAQLEVCQQLDAKAQAELSAIRSNAPLPGRVVDISGLTITANSLKKALSAQSEQLTVLENIFRDEVQRQEVLRSEGTKELREKLSQAQKFLLEARAADSKNKLEFDTRAKGLREDLRKVDRRLQELETMAYEGQALLAELEVLSHNKCPTCQQEWNDNETRVAEIKSRLDTIDKARLELLPLENRRRTTKELVDGETFTPDPRIEKLVVYEQQFKSELEAKKGAPLVIEGAEQLQEARQKLQEARLASQRASMEVEMAEAHKNAQDREEAQYDLRLQDVTTRSAEIQEKLKTFTLGLGAERDFVALLGREGFLGLIFEEVLAEIAAEANVRLARMANVSHVTLEFRTETQTQKGTTRRSITTVVNVGGREGRFESALSGGMQTSVEQAVDLAVMTVIQRRTGKAPGWICLDEIFEGQGRVSKESALEALREFSSDRLVVVIDHGEELKEQFSETIVVEHHLGASKVISGC